MRELPIRKIPGIGRVNERLLDSIGVKICGDIYKCRGVLSLLDKQFGLHSMLRVHLGIASNVVQPRAREERKSLGSERTFRAISEKETILQKLEDIAAELEDDMERGGWAGRTVTLKYKLDTYEVFTRAKSFNRWIKTKAELYEAGKELLQPEWPLRLRLIGLRVTKLKDLRKKKDDGIVKFLEPLAESPSKPSCAYDSDGQDSDVEYIERALEYDLNRNSEDGEDEGEGEDELPTKEPHTSMRGHRPPPIFAPAPSTSELLTLSRPSKLTASESSHQHMRSDERAALSPKKRSDPAAAAVSPEPEPESTSTAATVVSNCPLCTRAFTDNEELNAHIDWCLSREAIRSAQVEGDRGQQREPEVGSVQHPEQWWKAGSAEDTPASRKSKRRKMGG